MYNDDDRQPTLGYSDTEMLQRQEALRQVHSIEDWYRLYPQHAGRRFDRRPPNDKVATTILSATALANGQPAPRPAGSGKVMTSRYNGKCADCGGFLPEGSTIRYDGKAHHYPECPEQSEPVSEPEPEESISPTASSEPTSSSASIPDGKFTLEFEDGHHRTFRVITQKADASFAPGKRVVKYLSGSDNEFESSYTGFAFLEGNTIKLWSRFRSDSALANDAQALTNADRAKELGLKYALASGNCWRCGHTLTVPASIHAGVGPDCAKKLAAFGW